jgi:hypothetical protein
MWHSVNSRRSRSIESTGESHRRAFVVECMGRHCGKNGAELSENNTLISLLSLLGYLSVAGAFTHRLIHTLNGSPFRDDSGIGDERRVRFRARISALFRTTKRFCLILCFVSIVHALKCFVIDDPTTWQQELCSILVTEMRVYLNAVFMLCRITFSLDVIRKREKLL